MSDGIVLKLCAFLVAIGLHCGLTVWAMQPEPPVVIPEKQIIQVNMVAPRVAKSNPKQEVKKVPEVTKSIRKPDITVNDKGMRKVSDIEKDPVVPPKKPEKKKEQKKKEPKRKKEKEQKKKQHKHRDTSGAQSKKSRRDLGALTKPRNIRSLNNPSPSYPDQARRLRQQGTVLLKVRVKKNGLPRWVRIRRSSGYKALDLRALETVRRWKFIPARRGRKTVEASVNVPIVFRIKRKRR